MDDSSLEIGNDLYKPQKRILTFLFGKKFYPIPKDDSERKVYPEQSSNILYRVFFWWVSPLMTIGYTRTLQPNDLWILTEDMKVEHFYNYFVTYLQLETERAHLNHIANKCKERDETPETTTVTREEDLQDFVLSPMNIASILFLTFKRQILISLILAIFALSGIACSPLLTKELINFVERRSLGLNTNIGQGIGYSLGVVFMMLFSNLMFNHFMYIGQSMGALVKALLTKAVLNKAFKFNAESRHKFPQSKLTSIITTDLSRVEIACMFQPLLLCLPVPIAIAIVILVVNIRVSAVIGIVIFIIFLGCISFGAKKLFAYRDAVSKITDKRVNFMKEILNNLKMIKFYSWEHPYHENVRKIRGEEVDMILKIQTLRNVIFSLAMTLTGICSMIAFVILYAIQGSTSSPAKIFSSVSTFEILGLMVFFIPQALATTADMINGFKRVGAILSAGEDKPFEGYHVFNDEIDKKAIALKDASFSWDVFEDEEEEEEGEAEKKKKEEKGEKGKKGKSIFKKFKKKGKKDSNIASSTSSNDMELSILQKPNTDKQKRTDVEEEGTNFVGLKNLNLTINKGEFIVITGLVGSGKSSLLSAISGFMTCDAGEVDINGALLLCGAPWIQNNTIRENIVFGKPFDQEFYDKVIYSCALNIDLDTLEGGDHTEVGEKGITLSGGQKARINLARAVYANKEIILMDDVLSAVDARVGKHILNNCFLGLLSNKTRVLATHQLSLIGQADRIVFLNGDGSIDVGKMDELVERNRDFNQLMKFSKLEDIEEDLEQEEIIEEIDLGNKETKTELVPAFSTGVTDTSQELTRRRTNYKFDSDNSDGYDDDEYKDYNHNKDASKGKIITEEERAVNSIKFEVYNKYLKYGAGKLTPWGFFAIFAVLLTIATFCDIFTNTWLSFWISQKFPGKSSGFYIGFYVMFNILWVIFLTYTFVFFIHGTTVSSKHLNLMAIKRILHAPMSFMDTTPMGRILNRFTKDTDALDNEISDNLRLFFTAIAKMIGVFILIIIYLPWFACAIPGIFIMFFLIANFYQASNREVKRLEAILRSFVYNNVNEVLSGMNTIKAYKDEPRFTELGDLLLNKANEASFVVNANQKWLGIQLDILAEIIVLIVSLLCVNRVFSINAAAVGLLMTYTLQVANELLNLVRTFTLVENDMNSAERIIHYALKVDQEAPYVIDSNKPPADWPQYGAVEFSHVNMKYRPGLPLVLKDFSLNISPMEKIGICGRTGAGKSSIMTALYRISELDNGSIIIDNIDISTIGLKDLRSHLSIIPQDPVLFNGTIRSNLDPFGEQEDEVLWESLRRSGVLTAEEVAKAKSISKDTITSGDCEVELPKFHLYQPVEDEGENFSLGERQLISFARALVRNAKIIILDEATSSVDYGTDDKIQTTIAEEFKQCTILCIAHRLKTIINYDKILVMDKGSVREFDTPWNLYNSNGSVFREMCEKSNIVADDFKRR
ncbi:ABC transporter transmembrane region family protein [Candida parapsilosis]|uniref:Oligomycin resistance ATP-dependent permease YOR1 n=2 Tax=Candida parapsilosis TaxID=5480 RepID=G8BGB7_CANPC|nr:uncharacterized protein CPAR2_205440 [Candida parapsilosis]KAF6054950.1 ABC transporter transmembrane region family protein [Candida parapsilosis]KAF6056027.1 ABC transporter transmembrane region family protein [Candida parapsilosis]KAF6058957.1 ABC transporter transmembrane region family protein [Candida parapsilosis]KAF6067714.1 ABC transporter transmembrane region family protein [Candida parapsilosis]CCE42901.1 hypothetical protein CPAR2_205440 [Candida parapsilosis]